MKLTSFLVNGKLTIILRGEIDHHTAKGYIREIEAKIEAYTPECCVLDFADVGFSDSSGIAVVINTLRAMSQIEGSLTIAGLAEQPKKVFRAAGIDRLVTIYEKEKIS